MNKWSYVGICILIDLILMFFFRKSPTTKNFVIFMIVVLGQSWYYLFTWRKK